MNLYLEKLLQTRNKQKISTPNTYTIHMKLLLQTVISSPARLWRFCKTKIEKKRI